MADRFTFQVDGISQTLRVARLDGQEAISELFQFELGLVCEEAAIAAADIIGAKALLTINGHEDSRLVHGIVSRFEHGDAGKRWTSYRATLVPRLWRLQHRHDCRIFQELTVPAIIEKVLKGAGLTTSDYRLSIQGEHAAREYCVQYRESDWAFISRLMEEEGICYFFEHEEGNHCLVMGDKLAVHQPVPDDKIVFRPPLGAMVSGEHVSRFHYAEEMRPGKVTLRDYDFKKPSLDLEKQAEASVQAELEVYDYPGEYDVAGVGAALATIRLEEWQAARKTGEGEANCSRLTPGYLFSLTEHVAESFNREFLLTRVEHTGQDPIMGEQAENTEASYESRFHCMPSDVQFRPPQCTPKPTVKGMQTAIVVGPAGEEIYTDEFGRVKVHFHWDRLGKRDDKSSCWIRVSQVWAGEGWGAMHIPRIKQEVLVDFLEGDPDRPMIVGRVYHGTNVPPYALPGAKTQSTIKSNSSPGGEGSNEIRFEDKKSSEEIYLHAQKDWTIAVENDKNQKVGHDETLEVVNNRTKKIGADQVLEVLANNTETITKDEKLWVKANRDKKVDKNETETIGADKTIKVTGNHTETIGKDLTLSVTGNRTESVDKEIKQTIGTDMTLTMGGRYTVAVDGAMSTKVSAAQTEEVELEKSVTVGTKLEIVCGKSTITIDKDGKISIEGADVTIKSSDPVKIDGAKIDVTSSGPVNVTASGAVKVKGASVKVN